MIQTAFQLWLVPETSHSSTNKIATFLAYKRQPLLCDTRLSQTTFGIQASEDLYGAYYLTVLSPNAWCGSPTESKWLVM